MKLIPIERVTNEDIFCLRLPLGACKSKTVWDKMEKFHRRCSMWKRQYISKKMRLALVRSILSNLSIYFMSLVVIPKKSKVKVRKKKFKRIFYLRDGNLERNITWLVVLLFVQIKERGA